MPCDIIGGLISRIEDQLQFKVWDGEIPRYSTDGTPITLPDTLPIVALEMPDSGFGVDWTTEDAYGDMGLVDVYIWTTTRANTQNYLDSIFALLADNWDEIDVGMGHQVFKLMMERWCNVQEKNLRTADGSLIYRGELHYEVGVHGSVTTR